jgi:hypothetical protein
MKFTTRFKRGIFAVMIAGGVVVASAGGPAPQAQAAEVKGFPSAKVFDLQTGKEVDLAVNNGGKLPTLAWFWAPH